MAHPEWLVAGLGNPGPAYEATRHNIGFRVLDRLCAGRRVVWRPGWRGVWIRLTVAGVDTALLKPQTYMNHAGASVAPAAAELGLTPARVLVVHDDLDLEFARLRIRCGGGHGGHRGVRSIVQELNSAEFVRLKLGIGRPPPEGDVVDHVLASFSTAEEVVLSDLLGRAAEAVESIVAEGPTRAMNRFHT